MWRATRRSTRKHQEHTGDEGGERHRVQRTLTLRLHHTHHKGEQTPSRHVIDCGAGQRHDTESRGVDAAIGEQAREHGEGSHGHGHAEKERESGKRHVARREEWIETERE
jgi:hypothetical protein